MSIVLYKLNTGCTIKIQMAGAATKADDTIKIKIHCRDDIVFELTYEEAWVSDYWSRYLRYYGDDDDDMDVDDEEDEEDEDVIILELENPSVDSNIMESVIKFCKYYAKVKMPTLQKPLTSSTLRDNFESGDVAPLAVLDVRSASSASFKKRGAADILTKEIVIATGATNVANTAASAAATAASDADAAAAHAAACEWYAHFVDDLVGIVTPDIRKEDIEDVKLLVYPDVYEARKVGDRDITKLFSMIQAAINLQIKPLAELCYAKAHSLIKAINEAVKADGAAGDDGGAASAAAGGGGGGASAAADGWSFDDGGAASAAAGGGGGASAAADAVSDDMSDDGASAAAGGDGDAIETIRRTFKIPNDWSLDPQEKKKNKEFCDWVVGL